MGLPEICSIVPRHGAYSLLARRVGPKRAEEMILSGAGSTRRRNCRAGGRGHPGRGRAEKLRSTTMPAVTSAAATAPGGVPLPAAR